MAEKGLNPDTITGRINIEIFKILELNPEGVRWTDLLKMIQETDQTLHPKTINGCVWKFTENFPSKIYKPSKGMFRLTKYKN